MLGFLGMLGAALLGSAPSLISGYMSSNREKKRAEEERARLGGDYARAYQENSRRATEDINSLFSNRDVALAAGGVRDPLAKYRKREIGSATQSALSQSYQGQMAGLRKK